jgi:hypothetical protein
MTLLTEHNPLRNKYEADAKAAARWRDLQRLMDDDLSLERAYEQMMKVPEAMVEALMFSLRSGVVALERADTLRRLSELSAEQLREVATRVQKFKPNIASAWPPEEVRALALVKSRLP